MNELGKLLEQLREKDVKEESFVARELKAKAQLFEDRHRLYGDNYKSFGHVLSNLFPLEETFTIGDTNEMNRLGLLVQIVSKLTRYCQNFHKGGHADSLDDMAVYCMMLKSLDMGE